MDRKWLRIRSPGFVVLAAVAGLLAAGCGDDAVETCEYAGKTHEVGDLFPSSDGCNMCGCESGGEVVCTNRACSSEDGCDDDGVIRDEGERWSAAGGCSSCVCSSSGTITCSMTGDCEATCSYGGKRFEPGDSFPAVDGCNTCSCDESGEVGCTQVACGGSCEYAGESFPVGSSFKATDGCNECTCAGDRSVKCTTDSCDRCMYNGRSYAEGDEFVISDGCTSCVCGPNGGSTCNSEGCPDNACNYGAAWFEPGGEVICPDGCATCTCGGNQEWTQSQFMPDCRRRYAELCAAGPGQNRVDGSILYLSVDALAVETAVGCDSSYLLCFNLMETGVRPVPVDLWLVQLEASCAPDELKKQFVFDMASIRDHFWRTYPMQAPAVTLQMGDQRLDYSF